MDFTTRSFLDILVDAIDEVPQTYFTWLDEFRRFGRNPSWDNPADRELIRYSERTFCNELYHQLRMREPFVGSDGLKLKPEVVLQAEPIKRILPADALIPDHIQRLPRQFSPDLVLHTPGNFKNQEVVIEVKADPSLPPRAIIYDLEKLDLYTRNYGFKVGIFLAVNVSWTHILEQLKGPGIAIRLRAIQNRNLILVIGKESPGVPHTTGWLNNLI
jgi:hypothetical protein